MIESCVEIDCEIALKEVPLILYSVLGKYYERVRKREYYAKYQLIHSIFRSGTN